MIRHGKMDDTNFGSNKLDCKRYDKHLPCMLKRLVQVVASDVRQIAEPVIAQLHKRRFNASFRFASIYCDTVGSLEFSVSMPHQEDLHGSKSVNAPVLDI